jgi:hypothetical protein
MTREKRFHEQFVKEVAERLGVPPDQIAGPLSVYEGMEPDSLEVEELVMDLKEFAEGSFFPPSAADLSARVMSRLEKSKRWQFSLKRAMAGVGLLCIALSSFGIYRDIPGLAVFLGPTMLGAAIGILVGGRSGVIVGSVVGMWGSAFLYDVLCCWGIITT